MVSLKERLEQIQDLPALPAALGRLLEILNDEQASSQDVEAAIIIDRAIGMAVLRAANSARFGGSTEVGSLKDAVTRLGSRNLLHVALAQQSAVFFKDSGRGYGLKEAEAWEGALAGAIAGEALAKRCGLCEPGTAFTAALLRDCGKIAMDLLIGIDNLRGTIESLDSTQSLPDVEQDAFGFDHAEVGATLVEMWGLPAPLAEAIRHHHLPRPGEENVLIDVVYCADLVAAQLGYGVGLDGLHYTIDHDSFERVGLDQLAMTELMADVESRMEQFNANQSADETGRARS